MALSPLQQKVWDEAKALGYADDEAAVAVSVASAEGLGAGDNPTEPSSGNFQFYFGGGAGDAWSVQTGHSRADLQADPFLGDQWWLQGPLGGAIAKGKSLGLKGADLAKFAGNMAEKPLAGNEQNYATNYNKIFGIGDPASQIVDGPGPALPVAPAPSLDLPAGQVSDTWWQPGGLGDTPALPTGALGATDPNTRALVEATLAQAQATQQVAEATKGQGTGVAGAITAIWNFLTSVLTPGSGPWRGLEILFWKLIATLILGILLVVGVLRLTGQEDNAKTAAKIAATAAVA